MKALIPVIAIAGLSAGVFALGSMHKENEDKPLISVAEDVPLTVEVAQPQREQIVRLVQAPGDVEAVLEVETSSEIVAKIEEMPVEEGDWVKRGDLLCRLADDDLRAAVESGEAAVARLAAAVIQAEADIEQAERDCKRQARLSEVNATSDVELQNYLTIRKKARAMHEMCKQELAEAKARLRSIKEDLNDTKITSPIDGVISKLNAKEGEVVVTGTMNNPGTVIMTISDLSKMQVRCRVDEVDVPLVKEGQTAKLFLQADQSRPVPAQVVRVASKGDKQVGRDVVYFETLLEVMSTDDRIKPAMTANVEIQVADVEDAITIPVEAVVHRMRKDLPEEIVAQFDQTQSGKELSDRAKQAQYIKVAYVMDGEIAKVRLIDVGIADSRRVEVKSGIVEGDQVVIGPYRSLDQMKDGRKVKVNDDEKKGDKQDAEKTA